MSKDEKNTCNKKDFYINETDIKKSKLRNPFYDSSSGCILNEIVQFETLLYQPNNPIEPFEKRKYFLEDMLRAQDLLYSLDCIEALKYANQIVSGRQLLRKYLYSHYDINSCDAIKSRQKMSHINKFDLTMKIRKEIFHFSLENSLTPAESIREYIRNYLSEQVDLMEHSKKNCRLFSFCSNSPDPSEEMRLNCSQNCSSCDLKRYFYMPVYEIPLFLLCFTYADGRDFTNRSHNSKIPRYSSSRSFSKFSYQMASEKFIDLFYSDNTSALRPVDVSRLFCCDNALLFKKINKLSEYYNLYLSDSVLDRIIHAYKLKYNEILELKKYIEEKIFSDDFFIISGLRSDLLDFMLPFNIIFQHLVYHRSTFYKAKPISFETLKSDILTLKIISIIIFKISLPMSKYQEILHSILSGNSIDIMSTENDLYDSLKDNTFYQNYYALKNHAPNINKSTKKDNLIPSFLSFSIIKDAIEDIKYD